MIGKLKGTIDSYGDDWVIVDVHGVGYQVHASTTTLQALPQVGEAAVLFIETHVRETEIKLFGFASGTDREWFRLLMTVQGVGAKVALAVLSTLRASDLASAIALQDKAMVSRAPGVGPKVAQRIVAELKDKSPALTGAVSAELSLQSDLGAGIAAAPVADAVSALVNLGYAPAQASAALARIVAREGEAADAQTLIRLGLKELSGG
tara:strand:+ start:5220 stop:5840 length:621 start_codon:yes stop_codon:yes gene_type:complete